MNLGALAASGQGHGQPQQTFKEVADKFQLSTTTMTMLVMLNVKIDPFFGSMFMRVNHIPQNPLVLEEIAKAAEEKDKKTSVRDSEHFISDDADDDHESADPKKTKQKQQIPFYNEPGSILSLSYMTCYRGYLRMNTLKNSFSGDISCTGKNINIKIYENKIHMTGVQDLQNAYEVAQIVTNELRRSQMILDNIFAKINQDPNYLINMINHLLQEVRGEVFVTPSKLEWYRMFDLRAYKEELHSQTRTDDGPITDCTILHEKFLYKKYYFVPGSPLRCEVPEGAPVHQPVFTKKMPKTGNFLFSWVVDYKKIILSGQNILKDEIDVEIFAFLCQDLPNMKSYIRFTQFLNMINTVIYSKDIFILKERPGIDYSKITYTSEEKLMMASYPAVLKVVTIMANKNFNLGFILNKEKLMDFLPRCDPNFIVTDEKKNSCRVIFPYKDPDRIEFLKNKNKVNHHIFSVNKSGSVLQNGPGQKLMDDAFLYFISKILEIRHLITA